jgi:hypothetical protein
LGASKHVRLPLRILGEGRAYIVDHSRHGGDVHVVANGDVKVDVGPVARQVACHLDQPCGTVWTVPSVSRNEVRRRLMSSTVPVTPAMLTMSPLAYWFSIRMKAPPM